MNNTEKGSAKVYLITAAVFIYLGIGLYIFFELFSGVVVNGSVYLFDRKAHSAYNVSVTAEVADIDKQRTMSGQGRHRSSGVTYYVVYNYEYNGRSYTERSHAASARPVYEKGDSAEIFLDPSSPENVYDPKITRPTGTLARIIAAAVYAVTLVILTAWLISKIKRNKQGLQEQK